MTILNLTYEHVRILGCKTNYKAKIDLNKARRFFHKQEQHWLSLREFCYYKDIDFGDADDLLGDK